jgi:hypothetical protein
MEYYSRSTTFLGNSWSLWPPQNERGTLNIVSGANKITSDIISLCLTSKGECPLHPDYGIAPDLFQPFSGYDAQFWAYHLEQEIQKWVEGLAFITVKISNDLASTNNLVATIEFVPMLRPDTNILTFGFYEYQGAMWNQGIDKFMDAIALNGVRFQGF